MRKFRTLFIIVILVGIFCVIAFSHHGPKNRSQSTAMLEINAYYGSIYNPPTILSEDGTGVDGDGPLYSTASTWKGYTDDGYSDTREVVGGGNFIYPDDTERALNLLLDSGRYFEDNLKIANPNELEDVILDIISGEDFSGSLGN